MTDETEPQDAATTDVAASAGGFQLTTQTAEALKEQTATQRADLVRRQIAMNERLTAAKADMEARRNELEAQFNKQRNELEKIMAPLKAELARLTEMSWTVDLYLGRHEEIELVKDGKPAPADTPITIRQMVLAADEESLILGEEGSFDHRHMETFVAWLVADEAHLNRVLPEQRGVVVVVPTKQDRDYGNSYENASRAGANARAHWVIRNGERLYIMVTDEDLRVGERILPKRAEFVEYFYERSWGGAERVPLKPGSAEWLKAEDKADAHKRHYMRLMLVLQGLVDRTVAFHPLPAAGVNLMSLGAQDSGTVVLMNEEDRALTDGRPSFSQWQKSLNSQLRPGLRVILGYGVDQHSHDYGNSRISPARGENPPTSEPLMVEDTRDGGFVVRYARGEIWDPDLWIPSKDKPGWGHQGGYRPSKQRASCLLMAGDSWVLPFDLATVSDLTYYLNSRAARTKYESMVPVIHAALRAKKAEHEAEAPLRALLATTIAQRWDDADTDQVDSELDDLIRWWKVGNKYARPLAEGSETEAVASLSILGEWRRRQDNKPPAAGAAAAIRAAKSMPDALVAAYTRSKKFVVYSKTPGTDEPWLNEHTLRADGTVKSVKEWTTVATRTLATMAVLWQDDAWTTWEKHPDLSRMFSGPELDTVIEEANAQIAADGHQPFLTTKKILEADKGAILTVYAWLPGVDPTDQQAYARDGRHRSESGMNAFLSTTVYEVTRGVSEVKSRKVTGSNAGYAGGHWEQYSDHMGLANGLSLPYRAEDSKYRTKGCHRLAWCDRAELDRALMLYSSHEQMRTRQSRAEHDESIRVGTIALRWMAVADAAWVARAAVAAKADFLVDFGVDADDDPALWEHHLGTLRLADRKPRRPDWLDSMMRRLARASVNPDGKTIAELEVIDRGLRADVLEYAGTWATLPDWAELTITLPAETGDKSGSDA